MGHIILAAGIVGLLVYLLRRDHEGMDIGYRDDEWIEDTDVEEPTLEDPSAYPFSDDSDDDYGSVDWVDAYYHRLHERDN